MLMMFDGSMTVFFYPSSCPLHPVGGGVKKGRTHYKTWPSASAAFSGKPSSSVLLKTDGNDNNSLGFKSSSDLVSSPVGTGSGSPVLRRANTVGVIGGVSAVSTLVFLEKLVRWSSRDGEESLPFIVCSDPVLNRGLCSHERGSAAPYLSSSNSRFQLDRNLVVENLRHKMVFLERSGARCIVMPCHISHLWHREISDGCSVPFFHVGECVAKELKAANLKPVESGSNVRIGILATDATFTAGFYQDKIQDQGFEVVLPDKATMEHTVIPAVEALNRKDTEGARTLLRIALQVLLVRAVNNIILASDDMRGLLPQDDPLLKKCIDPMDALARSTILWAQSSENMHSKT